MNKHVKISPKSSRDYMTLEELGRAAPILATQDMPAEMEALLKRQSGPFLRSASKPKMKLEAEKVHGAPDIWQVLGGADGGEALQTTIHGKEQVDLTLDDAARATEDVVRTEGYRPPWMPMEFLPRLAPFRAQGHGNHVFMEPRALEGQRLPYPWCTIGIVFNSNGQSGSGVLVGPNLLLTAGHVAPWGSSPWSMEFVPAFRGVAGEPNPRPFGSSFVEAYRGYNTAPEVSGYDYVICKLYNPLGQALGWMGTQSWGDEDEYYRRNYTSSGYPDSFGGRPAVEFDMGIRDIDNDSPGLELETVLRPDLGAGWSGGPLWLPNEGPLVVGVQSGHETDGLDPRRAVYAGGGGMVDLVRFGLDNWRP